MSQDRKNQTSEKPKAKKHHLFEDISAVQVTATALAAVTSMLLSSYIGIAGSVIGVAVASVVSTMAASLYKHFLAESAEKIKEIPAVGLTHNLLEHGTLHPHREDEANVEDASGQEDHTDENAANGHKDDGAGPLMPAQSTSQEQPSSSDETIPIDELAIQSNEITIPVEELEQIDGESTAAHSSGETADEGQTISAKTASNNKDQAGSDEDRAIAEEALRSKKRMKIGLIIVCVVSALIAVALSAVVIYVSSSGEGIGTKPQQILASLETTQSSSKDGSAITANSSSNTSTSSSSSSASSSADSSASSSSSGSSADSSSDSSQSSSSDTENNAGSSGSSISSDSTGADNGSSSGSSADETS